MKVLAISAFKRSGKDTLADYLVTKYKANRITMASPLKDRVAKDFDIPREWCDDQNYKERPLLKYPVNPQDPYSLYVTDFMFKEFRSEDGQIASHWVKEKSKGLFGGELKTLYHTVRSLCILEGDTKRSVVPDYWVNKAILDAYEYGGLSIITDMRYRSEIERFKYSFGDSLTTIRIHRFDVSPSTAPSENDLNNYTFDYTIENKNTLQEFYSKIDELMAEL